MNRILKYFKAYKEQKRQNQAYLKELNWANIYHDSIRGKKEIENLSLNIGRWAGNYAFFYVLNNILNQLKPKNVVEFGLGESTKFVSTFLENYLSDTKHIVVEHDQDWIKNFNKNFRLNHNSQILHAPLKKRSVLGHETVSYDLGDSLNAQKFDLYVVDGPFGNSKFSRFDIVDLFQNISQEDNFVIIYDDYHRNGEKETIVQLLEVLKKNNVAYKMNVYKGIKDVCLIVSDSNRFLATL